MDENNNENINVNNNANNCINLEYKCDNIKFILGYIYELFKSIGIFDEFTFYLDNLSTINYLFSNDTNKIMLFCSSDSNINKFVFIQTKLKEIIKNNNDGRLKFVSMLSNYYSSLQSNIETNLNRQYDSLSFLYKFKDFDKQINITIYFFNSKLFFNEQRFNKLICEDFFYNVKTLFISSIYYCINDEIIYLIKDDGSTNKINDINKIINISIPIESQNIIIDNDNINFDDNMLFYDTYIFFDIFSYYLMTRDSKLKSNLINIIHIYSNNKNIKKKIKKQFDYNDNNYTTKLYILVNFIKNFSLEQICLDIIKEFPIINKILFGLSEELIFFDINIFKSFEIYVIAILFNKYKVFKTKNYINYINKNCSCSDDFNFSAIFDNKLELLRNIKKNLFSINYFNIPSKYYHFNKINYLCEILYVLLYSTKELNSNIEILKLSYIFKKFYFLKIDDFNYIFDIYNQILKNIGIDEKYFISNDNYFYTMYSNKTLLIKMEKKLLSELTIINKNYIHSFDSIDIFDIQDSIYLVWELLFLNKLDLTDVIVLKINLDDYHNSILANIRSNKLLLNNINDSDNLSLVTENNEYSKKYRINKNVDEIIDLNNIDCNNDNFDIENNIDKIFNMFIEDCDIQYNSNNVLNDDYNYEDINLDEDINTNENIDLDEDEDININDYLVDSEHITNKKKSNNIFNKFTNSIDDIINKINYFCAEELSDTSDCSESSNIIDLNDLNDLEQNNIMITENFINSEKKELKYQKYKNKYLRLKNIYQIISNEYFNINMFINQSNLGLSNDEIYNSILDYYNTSNGIQDDNINENNDDINNNNLCVINLNDIKYEYVQTNNDETKKIIQAILYDLVENIANTKVNFDKNEICVQVLNQIIDKIVLC